MSARILVCLDGSELAERAVAFATEQAHQMDASLELLEVIEIRMAQDAGPPPAESEHARAYLEGIAGPIREEGVQVETAVITAEKGQVGEAIEEFARQRGVEYIALTSHGQTGLGHHEPGSVCDHIISHTPVPLLLLKLR